VTSGDGPNRAKKRAREGEASSHQIPLREGGRAGDKGKGRSFWCA
jgi:hypothetical protein